MNKQVKQLVAAITGVLFVAFTTIRFRLIPSVSLWLVPNYLIDTVSIFSLIAFILSIAWLQWKKDLATINDTDIAKYLLRVQNAIEASRGAGFEVLVGKTEPIVADLTSRLQKEGIYYNTNNEPTATARALLWASWISWLWAAKAERTEQPDLDAKRIRPLAEKLLEHFIETGRMIGKNGRAPDQFLKVRGQSAD